MNFGDRVHFEAGNGLLLAIEHGHHAAFAKLTLEESFRAFFWREIEQWQVLHGLVLHETVEEAISFDGQPRQRRVLIGTCEGSLDQLRRSAHCIEHPYHHVFARRSLLHPKHLVHVPVHCSPTTMNASVAFFPYVAMLRKTDFAGSFEAFADPVCVMRVSIDGSMCDVLRCRTFPDLVMARLLEIC